MCKYYLFGRNVKGSFSPHIHTYCFHKLGESHTYQVVDQELGECRKRIEEEGFGGASVTIPYKKEFQEVEYRGVAKGLGNINTIVKRSGGLEGYNTDYHGVKDVLPLSGIKSAYVIGSGATSFTITSVLEEYQIPTTIFSRSQPSKEFKERFPNLHYFPLSDLYSEKVSIKSDDILICSIPSTPLPLNSNLFQDKPYVFDVNYRPKVTPFLAQALSLHIPSHKSFFGIQMLIAQGLEQNYLFTGQSIDREEATKDLLKMYDQFYNS